MAIQIRRGTNTEWENNNSNIVVGEPAIATDAERFFVGTASGDYAEFANLDIIAPAYDTSTSYVVGDVINRQGKLYSCNTPCSGAFNVSYWDEKSLAEILKDLENEIDYAQYEIGYASGELITIDNGASEIPVKDLTLGIEAVQSGSGDPSPTNIRPINGWDEVNVNVAGKNLWGGLKFATDIKTLKPDSVLNTTNKTIAPSGVLPQATLYDKFKPNTRYTLILKASSMVSSGATNLRVNYTDGTYSNLFLGEDKTKVFTTSATKSVLNIRTAGMDTPPTLLYDECGLFEGVLTAQDFEPYNGQTYTIDLNGTRYGGTLDVTTGVLTLTHGYVDLGTLNWTKITNNTYGDYFRSAHESVSAKTNSAVICSQYNSSTLWYIRNTNVDKAVGAEGGYVEIRDLLYTDATSFKNALIANNAQLVYKLATPQTVQLTPTQVRTVFGTNNLWNQMNSNNELAYRISNALN